MRDVDIVNLIKRIAPQYGIPEEIVWGVIQKESSGRPGVHRHEPRYRYLYQPKAVKPKDCTYVTEVSMQRTSIGLMQVMGATYRELGYTGWLGDIFADPRLQVEYGCKYLAQKIRKYGLNKGILSYNSGSPKRDPNNPDQYINQYYLDKVLKLAKGYPG